MTKIEILDAAERYAHSIINAEEFLTAVEAYSSASNNGKPDVIGALPLSEDDLKEEVKSLYVANYKDYALVNADESFRDGIALGCWGMNEKLKRQ